MHRSILDSDAIGRHRLRMPFTIHNLPSSEDYRRAFERLLEAERLTESNLRVLRAHYSRPRFRTTSQQLRDSLGFTGIGGSNRAYGAVAEKVANEIDFDTPYPENKRSSFWRALSDGDGSGDHYTWILRPEVVRSLEDVGLVDPNFAESGPVNDPDIHEDPNRSAIEGRRRLVLHLERERNRTLVNQKKEQAKSLACEICGFLFSEKYGEIGADYCEAHHLVPLADADVGRETLLSELMLVCANCHRVIHLRNPPYEPDEVREMIRRSELKSQGSTLAELEPNRIRSHGIH